MPHKPDCRCPACTNRRRSGGENSQFLSIRVSAALKDWIDQNGGSDFARKLLQQARDGNAPSVSGAAHSVPDGHTVMVVPCEFADEVERTVSEVGDTQDQVLTGLSWKLPEIRTNAKQIKKK